MTTDEMGVEPQRQLVVFGLETLARIRSQHHGAARYPSDCRGGGHIVPFERRPGVEHVARPAVVQPLAVSVMDGDPPRDEKL